jgi:hypothetical protein
LAGTGPKTQKTPDLARRKAVSYYLIIRHAVWQYDRNGPDRRILGYDAHTPELRPEHTQERVGSCNLVPGHRRCRYWWHPHSTANDPDEQAGYPHDWAGVDVHPLRDWSCLYAEQEDPQKART